MAPWPSAFERLVGWCHRIPRGPAYALLALLLSFGVCLVVGLREAQGAPKPTAQLPNLVAKPPDGVKLETNTTEGGLTSPGEPKLLLRFNGYVHNAGPGALDFRGFRNSPSEPMKAFQRIYYSNGSFTEKPSSADLIYVSADGHDHWHLQSVARYSLWNLSKTAEAAPAMKVGFCLNDSHHIEPNIGPKVAVYSDATGREFCRQHQPETTTLFEGISAGWFDYYASYLPFQWVDASDVLPGKYWLREDVNTTRVIKEVPGAKAPAYAASPTTIPGFDARAQSTSTRPGRATTVTLISRAWNDSATPTYTVVSQPRHGTLSAVNNNHVTYTPAAGFSGIDSFTVSAADPNSPFPRHPSVATVSIEVTARQRCDQHGGGSSRRQRHRRQRPQARHLCQKRRQTTRKRGRSASVVDHRLPAAAPSGGQPAVMIEGAPASITAGTTVQLAALVINDGPSVAWRASAGAITPGGRYAAPSRPPNGSVVISAVSPKGASDRRTITIDPVQVNRPAPAAPIGAPSKPQPLNAALVSPVGSSSFTAPALSAPEAVLVAGKLVMTTTVAEAGRVSLSAQLGEKLLGRCAVQTPGNRAFTCQLKLGGVTPYAPILVSASLRTDARIEHSQRPAGPVPPFEMSPPDRRQTSGPRPSWWHFVCGL